MRRTLLLGPITDHGNGESSVRVGRSVYLLDTDVASQLRTLSAARHAHHALTHGEEAFGLARATYYLLTGRVPGDNDILIHANCNSKDLRRNNVTPGHRNVRCHANLKRGPQRDFDPDAGVDRLGPRRYRARLQRPCGHGAQHLGIHPTRLAARAARLAAHQAHIDPKPESHLRCPVCDSTAPPSCPPSSSPAAPPSPEPTAASAS